MVQGETLVTCPQCGAQSRVPIMDLHHISYHCSRCGNLIPLATANLSGNNGNGHQSPIRSKRLLQKHKRH